MPELPEVEVVRAGLAPAVTGALITAVDVRDLRILRRNLYPESFHRTIAESVLSRPQRRGKFLWMPWGGTPGSLVVHLGMSGQLLLRTPDEPLSRHTRVALHLLSPEHGELRLDFADQRIFGWMAVGRDTPATDAPDQLLPHFVVGIARDPLDPLFDDDRFLAALRRRRSGIKRALLDQSLISGIGNIYADEALWAARLHYDHPADRLGEGQAAELLEELRAVLLKALAEGGTSFDSQYLNVNGQAGYFAHSLNAYGRQGRPCPRCGTPIVRESFMNRGSHLCPSCQRLPEP